MSSNVTVCPFVVQESYLRHTYSTYLQCKQRSTYIHTYKKSYYTKNVSLADLKPQNIGFTGEGKLKLLDFGLAACVKKRQLASNTYAMSGYTGTPVFMVTSTQDMYGLPALEKKSPLK